MSNGIQLQTEPKWFANINDTVVPAPRQKVPVGLLKATGNIPPDKVLVRDHNSPNDPVLADDLEIDLSEGNTFYTLDAVPSCERPICDSKPKLSYLLDDIVEVSIADKFSPKNLYLLFNMDESRLLFRDFESPSDIQISDEDLLFSDGPVFYTRDGVQADCDVTIIINARPRKVMVSSFTYKDLVKLAFPDANEESHCFTITYSDGPCRNPEGKLVMGETVNLKDGMIFNVKRTDKS